MPRRALRPIKAELDLSRHFLTPEQFGPPWNPQALFGNEHPVQLEVGCGKGLFMATACQAFPEQNFLGIEIAYRYARFSAARLVKRGLENGRMVAGDGQKLLHEVVPDNALDAVHVYFPDPWWKKRHHKRRVLNEEFLTQVARTLRPGGSLHFWTDVEEYFRLTLELIAEKIPLTGPLLPEERAAEHNLDYRTHFERRTRLAGLPVYRSEFRKPGPALEISNS